MKTFNDFLQESLDSIKPKPVSFGSDVDFFGGGESYTDKKFEPIDKSLYRTVFKAGSVWVQVLFDKSNSELLFMTSDSDDITSFDTNKKDVSGDIKLILSNVMYIIPFLIKQLKLQKIVIGSKMHTKRIYDLLFSKNALLSSGLEAVSKVDIGADTQYTFKVK